MSQTSTCRHLLAPWLRRTRKSHSNCLARKMRTLKRRFPDVVTVTAAGWARCSVYLSWIYWILPNLLNLLRICWIQHCSLWKMHTSRHFHVKKIGLALTHGDPKITNVDDQGTRHQDNKLFEHWPGMEKLFACLRFASHLTRDIKMLLHMFHSHLWDVRVFEGGISNITQVRHALSWSTQLRTAHHMANMALKSTQTGWDRWFCECNLNVKNVHKCETNSRSLIVS